MADRRKTRLVGDLGNVEFAFPNQFQRLLQTGGLDEFRDRLIGKRFEFTVKMHAAHAEVPPDAVAAEIGLVDVFQDVGAQFCDKFVFLPVGFAAR